MKVSEFDYELPPERIAQEPSARREDARLLVHEVATNETAHRVIRDLPELLRAGDLLVVNDTRVRRARLHLRRTTGGAVELLLFGPEPGCEADSTWRCMAKPAARLKPGEIVADESGEFQVRMRERVGGPEWLVDLPQLESEALEEQLEKFGTLPLPPYIQRQAGSESAVDAERYQTVYSDQLGAVAAPTAGLHFTQELLQRLEATGIESARVTLHVGAGTFQPIGVEETDEHEMHSEEYLVPQATVDAVARCRARGGRVVAVGTTSLRALESSLDADEQLISGSGATELFVTPGYRFAVVDVLLTNFHLPRSTLLMLVAAFCGQERMFELYREAIEREYRFYSYGDAMLLTR